MKQILRNTRSILTEKEKKRFIVFIILDVIISIIDILSLALLLWIIQFYIQPGDDRRLAFLPAWLYDRGSIWFIGIFFLLFGLKNLAGYFISHAHYQFIGNVATRISRNNLLKYQQAGFEEFINTDSSVHIRKINLQPFEFCQYILSGIRQIITQTVLILLTIVAIVLFNAKLFLLLLAILLPPVIGILYFIRKRINNTKKNIRSGNERSFQYLLDALKGYVESNVYGRNDFFLRRFIGVRKKFSTALFESISIQNMPSRIIEIFAILGLFALIAIAKWTGNNDSSTLLTIGAFMAAAYKIIPGVVKIINVSGQIRAYEFSATDLAGVEDPAIPNPGKTNGNDIHSLELLNISFHYPGQPVLKGLSLKLAKGDFIGITGDSGKGKTTILNILLGFISPSSGQVFINNQPLSKDKLKNHWGHIAYVRQQPFLIHDTIIRNITLEETSYDEKALQHALQVSGLTDIMSKSPEGSAKIITENGKNISGGQQQRIAIARAIYKNAELFLLDEPFNELDEGSTVKLLQHFKEESMKGKIVIMITHDKKSLSYCNKIISLNEP